MALQNYTLSTMNTYLNNIYYIPNYQREYSWETTELEDFWEDLIATRDDQSLSTHFFGQIVVHNNEDEKKKYIIDGQQRTTTATIFMRAMQILYEDIYINSQIVDADYKKSDISSMHIGRKDKLHLTLGETDKEYFINNIQLGKPSDKKEKKKSQERMHKAFLYFSDMLLKQIEGISDYNDQIHILNEIYSTFTDRFCVLYMEATKLEEAFIIFETLNARGKELETADLLKNYIFNQSKDINTAQSRWTNMVNHLDKVDTTKYIRHFWNSGNPFTRDKTLYRAISKEINKNPRKSKELLKQLEQFSQCYHDLVLPEDAVELKDQNLLQSLKSLKILKASTFYPVILAMRQKEMPEKDIAKVSEMIESYVFRNFTICGKVANKAEVFFANLARDIYDELLSTADSICEEINKEIVTDKEFSDAFELWVGTKSGKETIRYILRKIHKRIDKNNELNIDNSEVHIEHIMPEDCKYWNVSQEEHDNYLWRLGNLALLSGPINISISNNPFNLKKPGYSTSKIEPNKEIAKYEEWNAAAIEDRQKRLTAYALEIWKVLN